MGFLYTAPVYRIGDTIEINRNRLGEFYPLEGISLYFFFKLWYNYYSK